MNEYEVKHQRLVEAAPDMVAALKALKAAITDPSVKVTVSSAVARDNLDKAAFMTDMAIAKALGEY